MIEVQNTDVNIVKNLIPMRNHMPASAYGLKAISDWFILMKLHISEVLECFFNICRNFYCLKTRFNPIFISLLETDLGKVI